MEDFRRWAAQLGCVAVVTLNPSTPARLTRRVFGVLAVIFTIGACGAGEHQKSEEPCAPGACSSPAKTTSASAPAASTASSAESVPSSAENVPSSAENAPSSAASAPDASAPPSA